jgi:hypothetical protein
VNTNIFTPGEPGLVDADEKIAGTVGAAVASVAKPDWDKHVNYGENGRSKRKIFDNSLFAKHKPVAPSNSK